MSDRCQKCGAPVASGAFLGLCPACSQSGETGAGSSVSVGGGGKAWVKPLIIVGVILALLFVVATVFLTAGAPVKVQQQTVPTRSR